MNPKQKETSFFPEQVVFKDKEVKSRLKPDQTSQSGADNQQTQPTYDT